MRVFYSSQQHSGFTLLFSNIHSGWVSSGFSLLLLWLRSSHLCWAQWRVFECRSQIICSRYLIRMPQGRVAIYLKITQWEYFWELLHWSHPMSSLLSGSSVLPGLNGSPWRCTMVSGIKVFAADCLKSVGFEERLPLFGHFSSVCPTAAQLDWDLGNYKTSSIQVHFFCTSSNSNHFALCVLI